MNKWYVMTAATGLVAIASIVWAGPGEGRGRGGDKGPGPHRGGGLEALLRNPETVKALGITEEQVSALEALRYEGQKQRIDLQRDAQLARLEVKKLMDADTPDKEAIFAAVDKAGVAMTALRKAGIEQKLQVREILGNETLAKIREHARTKMHERRERGGPHEGRGDAERRGPGVGFEQGEDGPGFDMDLTGLDNPPWMQDEMPPPPMDGDA